MLMTSRHAEQSSRPVPPERFSLPPDSMPFSAGVSVSSQRPQLPSIPSNFASSSLNYMPAGTSHMGPSYSVAAGRGQFPGDGFGANTGSAQPHFVTGTSLGSHPSSVGSHQPQFSVGTSYGANLNLVGSAPSHSSGVSGLGKGYSCDVVHDNGPSQRLYGSETRSSQNYSYISNASEGADTLDSKNSDFFLPEPKKRLFDSEDEAELGSPVKTTKML